MSEYPKTIQAEKEPNVVERFSLPVGFVTEKGSAYTYYPNGQVHRDKFDGTQSEAGIAVFIEDTPENLDILTRIGASQGHLPLEQQKRAYILQLEEHDGKKSVKGKVYKTSQVTDESNLAFALINGVGQMIGWVPANLQPELGSHVFEMDKLDDGRTMRHPGHRVTDIIR